MFKASSLPLPKFLKALLVLYLLKISLNYWWERLGRLCRKGDCIVCVTQAVVFEAPSQSFLLEISDGFHVWAFSSVLLRLHQCSDCSCLFDLLMESGQDSKPLLLQIFQFLWFLKRDGDEEGKGRKNERESSNNKNNKTRENQNKEKRGRREELGTNGKNFSALAWSSWGLKGRRWYLRRALNSEFTGFSLRHT